jgi:signal transduction histidine kinase
LSRKGEGGAEIREEAGELENARRQWLAQASHEVRTPLTIIKSHAALLRDKQEGLMRRPEQMREIIEAIADSTDQLQDRLEELLDLLKLEIAAPEPRLAALDPGALLEEEALALAGRAGRVVRVDRSGEGNIQGDPAHLKRAFGYLLEYVVRTAAPQEEPRIVFKTGDDGWGIRLAAGRRTKAEGGVVQIERGMGLHLYYASRVIEAQGGRLRLDPPEDL